MATFQFTSRRVDLDFPGGIKHTLPLTEEMRHTVEAASKELLDKTSALRGKAGTEEDMETLCDYTLDAVDAILGEGAAEQIMESNPNYSFLDCCDLFKFVTSEFNTAFIQEAMHSRRRMASLHLAIRISSPFPPPIVPSVGVIDASIEPLNSCTPKFGLSRR